MRIYGQSLKLWTRNPPHDPRKLCENRALKETFCALFQFPLRGQMEGQTTSKGKAIGLKPFCPYQKESFVPRKGENTGHETTTHIL